MTFCVPPVTSDTSSSGPSPSPCCDIHSATAFRSTSPTWQNLLRGCAAAARTSALRTRGVPDRLRPDHAVAEHESVDPVVHPVSRRIGGPLEEQQVAIEDLVFEVPCRVRQIAEQLGEGLPYAILPARYAGRSDQHGIVGVVDDDLV